MMCLIAGRTVVVGTGTTLQKAGDVGRLVVPRWFVFQEGLAISEPTAD